MVHNQEQEDDNFMKIDEFYIFKEAYRFSRKDMKFFGYNFGGKITVFFLKDDKVIFKIAGHRSWSALGMTEYHSPILMIGKLKDEIFTQYHNIEYTKKYTKQARLKAMELIEQLK